MGLKSYKLPYQVYNLLNKKLLKHNVPLYKKYGLRKTYFSSISSEDFKDIAADPPIYDTENSMQKMPDNPDFKTLDGKVQEALLPWSENGYAILRDFFSAEEVNTYNQEIERLIASKEVKFRYGNKIMFAIHHSDLLKNAGAGSKLMAILKTIMGKDVELFQSINFLRGSGQRAHSDSIHMTTFPYGNLVAVWVALEDISENCGPLKYYPGSHKLPYVMNRDFGNLSSRHKLGDKSYIDYEDHIEKIVVRRKPESQDLHCQKRGHPYLACQSAARRQPGTGSQKH